MKDKKHVYITITGMNHYFGNEYLVKGQKLKLKKDPDNPFDEEAIAVRMKGLGLIGYVANSTYTVKGETISAGRLYDRIGNKATAKVVYVLNNCAVARITGKSLKK